MSMLAWIMLGLATCFLASKIVNSTGEGTVVDILLGIAGAIIGGWLFNFFGAVGLTGFNIYSCHRRSERHAVPLSRLLPWPYTVEPVCASG